MRKEKRIYCIEGVHDWGDGEVEPTVEPMLELLQRVGCWDYAHRTCATMDELKYRLETEWLEYCSKGSVLYFNTHGAANQLWLRKNDQPVGLLTLKEWIYNADGCHIHFGGCSTFSGGQANVKDLMQYTDATSVSGYGTDCDWLAPTAPALALELLFFGRLSGVSIGRNTRARSAGLRKIRDDVSSRFSDCEFEMLVRSYRRAS